MGRHGGGAVGACCVGREVNNLFDTSFTIFGVLDECSSSILFLRRARPVVIMTRMVSASRLFMASFRSNLAFVPAMLALL
jgi:hypothetical protein